MRVFFCGLIVLLQAAMPAALAPVAVTGATGKLGRAAVQQLVAKNVPVRVLMRHTPAPASEASSAPEATAPQVAAWLNSLPGVTLVKGDINDRESVCTLLSGCSACIACHGARRMWKLSDLWSDPSGEPTHSKQVNYVGVQNIIDAARASGTCRRIVRVTGACIPSRSPNARSGKAQSIFPRGVVRSNTYSCATDLTPNQTTSTIAPPTPPPTTSPTPPSPPTTSPTPLPPPPLPHHHHHHHHHLILG